VVKWKRNHPDPLANSFWADKRKDLTTKMVENIAFMEMVTHESVLFEGHPDTTGDLWRGK
jgi:hypothetical protein